MEKNEVSWNFFYGRSRVAGFPAEGSGLFFGSFNPMLGNFGPYNWPLQPMGLMFAPTQDCEKGLSDLQVGPLWYLMPVTVNLEPGTRERLRQFN